MRQKFKVVQHHLISKKKYTVHSDSDTSGSPYGQKVPDRRIFIKHEFSAKVKQEFFAIVVE